MSRYKELLASTSDCPFCDLPDGQAILTNTHAQLVLAKAPYSQDHLLVITRDHHLSRLDISAEEKAAVDELVAVGLEALYAKGYTEVVELLRDGRQEIGSSSSSGKTKSHFHIHLIPDTQVTAVHLSDQAVSDNRKVYTDTELLSRTQDWMSFMKESALTWLDIDQ